MLLADNIDLVKRDCAIPGLCIVLDPELFIKALKPFFSDCYLREAEITYIRYKPGMNCLVTYSLETSGGNLEVYAKAHGYDCLTKFQKARERECVAVAGIPGRIFLEDISLIISLFPNDSKLKCIRRLGDTIAREKLFRRLFPDIPEFWGGHMCKLTYKPERRYVGRLNGINGASTVLKFYTETGYLAAYERHKVLGACKSVRFAEMVGHSNSNYIMAFEWLQGDDLQYSMLNSSVKLETFEKVGAELAKLHSSEIDGLIPFTRNEESTKLHLLTEKLKFLCPHLGSMAESISKQLATWLTSQSNIYRPVHGDFYAKQVMVSNTNVTIIDLDNAALSDPRADLGLFLAHIEQNIIRGLLPDRNVTHIMDALLKGYSSCLTENFLLDDLEVYTAIGLFQLIHHPFRRHESGWQKLVEAILYKVDMYIRKSTIGKSKEYTAQPMDLNEREAKIPVVDKYSAGKDDKMSFLTLALDPSMAESCLDEMFSLHRRDYNKFRLLSINVVRYKHNRRCMVEYKMELDGPHKKPEIVKLIGKAHARRLDKSTHDLCRDLWKSGFHNKSTDRISIPEPLGFIPEMQMWFQKKINGDLATGLLVKDAGVELSKRIAEAAHKLHQVNIPCRKKHFIADELDILRERLPLVAKVKPGLKQRLIRLLNNCDRLAATVPVPVHTGIHRDFYADQILIDGDRLYLIDLDLYCKGDPGLDIGNFIGHLTEYSLRVLNDPEALIEQEKALEERFLQLAGCRFRTSVQAYAILTLVRHVYISTTFADRQPYTESLLELCEQRIATQLSVLKRR